MTFKVTLDVLPATCPDDEIGKHSGLRNRGDKLGGSSPSQGMRLCTHDGIGRHMGLKIPGLRKREGSTPSGCTNS